MLLCLFLLGFLVCLLVDGWVTGRHPHGGRGPVGKDPSVLAVPEEADLRKHARTGRRRRSRGACVRGCGRTDGRTDHLQSIIITQTTAAHPCMHALHHACMHAHTCIHTYTCIRVHVPYIFEYSSPALRRSWKVYLGSRTPASQFVAMGDR